MVTLFFCFSRVVIIYKPIEIEELAIYFIIALIAKSIGFYLKMKKQMKEAAIIFIYASLLIKFKIKHFNKLSDGINYHSSTNKYSCHFSSP